MVVGGKDAAVHACVIGARVVVVTHNGRALAQSGLTGIASRAAVAVGAGGALWYGPLGAACQRVAAVRRARVVVGTDQGCAHARALYALVRFGAR